MRKQLLTTFVILSFVGYSQNWNVFNKAYRYNYTYNNSQLVSNVLFAETTTVTGADTVYNMNNIGVVTGVTLTLNQPQFLMRKIIKKANGDVHLQDTTNITIIPTCTLNQSWIFDTNYNLTATCVSTSTRTIFNVVDSVKVIMVDNVDSLVISKRFGIVQFPVLYAQNNYYRLVGIEKANRYEKNPLFGQKVPNAWDFYNFDIGRQWCESSSHFVFYGPGISQSCLKKVFTITSKTVTNTGFVYNVSAKYIENNNNTQWCSYSLAPVSYTNHNISFTDLDTSILMENRMYPGQVLLNPLSGAANITQFGMNTNITGFKKFFGPYAGEFSEVKPEVFIFGHISFVMVNAVTYTAPASGMDNYTGMFGYGVGKMADVNCFAQNQHYFYSGCDLNIGMAENTLSESSAFVYPNPAYAEIYLPIEQGKVQLFDVFGKTILSEFLEKKNTIDVSQLPNGLYFVEIQSDSFKHSQKLIIQH